MGKENKKNEINETEKILVNNEKIEAQNLEKLKKNKKDYSRFSSKVVVFIFGIIFFAALVLISYYYCFMLSELFTPASGNDLGQAVAIFFGAPVVLMLWVPIIILFFVALLLFIIAHRSKFKGMRILAPIFTMLTIIDFGAVIYFTYYIFQVVMKQ